MAEQRRPAAETAFVSRKSRINYALRTSDRNWGLDDLTKSEQERGEGCLLQPTGVYCLANTMLRAHSFLWHYLWVAPNVFLLVLAFLIGNSRLRKQFPAFFAFAALAGLCGLTVYLADMSPSVSPENFWRVDWATLLLEGLLKFVLVGEIFANAFGPYSQLARLGKFLIRALGVLLLAAAAIAAAYAPKDSPAAIVSGAHLLEQTIYLVESGLLIFIFLFAGYFSLRLSRPILGIAIGLSLSACVHLGTFAVAANGGLPDQKRIVLDFINMGTYHVSVLIWFYYLVVPHKIAVRPETPIPENNLAVWNRELERLLQL
jgi:hypothetical protein